MPPIASTRLSTSISLPRLTFLRRRGFVSDALLAPRREGIRCLWPLMIARRITRFTRMARQVRRLRIGGRITTTNFASFGRAGNIARRRDHHDGRHYRRGDARRSRKMDIISCEFEASSSTTRRADVKSFRQSKADADETRQPHSYYASIIAVYDDSEFMQHSRRTYTRSAIIKATRYLRYTYA